MLSSKGGSTSGRPPASCTDRVYPDGIITLVTSRQCEKAAGTSYAQMPISGRLRSMAPGVYEWPIHDRRGECRDI